MTIMPFWKTPADPMPTTARPTMNATDDGAVPHTALPISKIRWKSGTPFSCCTVGRYGRR
ncbi:uncharacterized protein M421DRAFT_424210 [Didymella exigua CBS 183.55]|uniref:Uncharacterized protein n=1 Tax=Didymella exigua CBS 183.55 TaxID=1150837 RepID=A0A6A5RBF8_9PLEO|nr:uncharacterized protein M421DRAFT_424210 [Didymella exigua CBS 183.55]KAF1924982.1 hypothetical protein M421DRAFT_424210 [Didymella exigua CBS 183.55]